MVDLLAYHTLKWEDIILNDFIVHETAIVDPGAMIGEGSRIWHWVHVSGGQRLEECFSWTERFVGNKVRW